MDETKLTNNEISKIAEMQEEIDFYKFVLTSFFVMINEKIDQKIICPQKYTLLPKIEKLYMEIRNKYVEK